MKTTTFLFLLTTSLAIRNQIAADGGEYGTVSPRLSLGEVTRAVLENSPAIKEVESRWQAAIYRVRQANAWDDPRIAGESRVRRFVDIPPNAFMDQTLGIEQLIPITGKNLVRGRIAGAASFSAFEEARRTQLDVIAKARGAYFQLANAYDQLDINSKNLTSLKQIADISRSRYETGLESAANVLIAETDYSKLLEARTDLERSLSDAQSQLNTLMNRDAFARLGVPTAFSEYLGYPTQKPLMLLERIIKASSNENDIVLDAFCGCGTALVAAQKLKRQWVGIDFPPTACRVVATRLKKDCGLKEDEKLWAIGRGFVVRDLPKTEEELRKYPPFEFENWAVVALGGIPNKAQVGDMGIDGRIFPVGAMPAARSRETPEWNSWTYGIRCKSSSATKSAGQTSILSRP